MHTVCLSCLFFCSLRNKRGGGGGGGGGREGAEEVMFGGVVLTGGGVRVVDKEGTGKTRLMSVYKLVGESGIDR